MTNLVSTYESMKSYDKFNDMNYMNRYLTAADKIAIIMRNKEMDYCTYNGQYEGYNCYGDSN